MKTLLRYMSYSLLYVSLPWLAGRATLPQPPAQTFALNGLVVVNREAAVVLNRDYTPERGAAQVEVELRGGGIEQRTYTDQNGEFRFEVPAGTYELTFRHPEYYETSLKGVEVKEKPSSTLKVALPLKITLPQLIWQRDPEIIGPKIVPAPSLQLSFEPRRPLAAGRPMRGTLTMKNVGREPILVPTELVTRDSQYSPRSKIMQISISVDGYYDYYEEKYICVPSKSCKELRPSEAASFPITIYERKAFDDGRRVARTYPKRGEYKLKASVNFKLPIDDPNKDIDIRTEAIKSGFTVLICN